MLNSLNLFSQRFKFCFLSKKTPDDLSALALSPRSAVKPELRKVSGELKTGTWRPVTMPQMTLLVVLYIHF